MIYVESRRMNEWQVKEAIQCGFFVELDSKGNGNKEPLYSVFVTA